MAAGDLVRRPPQELRRGLRARGRAAPALEEDRVGAREQEPAQIRTVRMHGRRGSGDSCCDVGRRDVRLLRGEAAVLDRAARHVAGRPDALDAAHAAVRVDGDEPAFGDGQPVDRGALEQRQRHRQVDVERPLELEPQPAVVVLLGERAGTQLHAGRCEPARHRGTGLGAEDVERLGLTGHELDPEVEPLPPSVFRRHQGQLVERQRPGDTCARHEGDDVAPAGIQGLERVADGGDVARPGERQRAGHGDPRLRAQREQQRVVVDRRSVPGDELPVVQPHDSSMSGIQSDAAVARDELPVVAGRGIAAEGLGDRERAIGEMAGGGEDADPQRVGGELLEREQPLEGADAASGDDDVWVHAPSVPLARAGHIGADAQQEPWKPAGRAWR